MVRKSLLFKQAKSNIPSFISVIKLPDLLLVLINCTETNGAKWENSILLFFFPLFFFFLYFLSHVLRTGLEAKCFWRRGILINLFAEKKNAVPSLMLSFLSNFHAKCV